MVLIIVAAATKQAIFDGFCLNGQRESEVKTSGSEAHIGHVERRFARPFDALNALVAHPTVVVMAHPKRVFFVERQPIVAFYQPRSFAKSHAKTLPLAAHFLGLHAQQPSIIHFAHKKLPRKRPEFSVGVVQQRLRGRMGNFGVRKRHGFGRAEAVELGNGHGERHYAGKARSPNQARHVAIKIAFLNVIELARSQPITLIIRHVQIIFCV